MWHAHDFSFASTDATVAAISKFPKFEDINLEGCNISDASLNSIAQNGLANFKGFVLSNTVVSKKAVEELQAKLPKVEFLH